MSKLTIPINLKKYSILTPGVTQQDVEEQLKANLEWIMEQQVVFYEDNATRVITKIMEGSIAMKGSVNAMGRQLGIEPVEKAAFQPYNLSEMFRAVIVSKLGLLVQQEALAGIITHEENPTPASVQDAYSVKYPTLKKLPYQYVKRTIDRILRTGLLDSFPRPSQILPFWACDTHYSKLTREGRKVFFSFKIENKGMVTLEFLLPASARFAEGKVTRPTVRFDVRKQLTFGFTIQKPAPKLQSHTSIMGVDLGRRVPFVATVVSREGSYSQPIVPNKRVNVLSEKIENLSQEGALLFAKESLNVERGHLAKAEVLKIERLRVRSKCARLKAERVQHVARHITLVAQKYNTLIVLEDLSWVPNSKWEQSLTQTAITHAAQVRGVRVRKVNPKNTSQECVDCGAKVRHVFRTAHCTKCSKSLNRDVLASRNIAKRAGASYQCYSPLITRLAEPVTPGSITVHDPLTAKLAT